MAVCIFLFGCGVCNGDGNGAHEKKTVLQIEQIKKDTPMLDMSTPHSPAGSVSDYFMFYGLAFKNTRHYFGKFLSGSLTLSTHVFVPQRPKGTIFLLHGYLDHTGTLKHLIGHCLLQQYAVAVYDLPGHGLSSGDRLGIDDFYDYVTVFKAFIRQVAPALPEPHHLVGHSTGCAIIFEYLNHAPVHKFEKLVFLAPLVHNAHWKWSKAGYFMLKPFADTLPRKIRNNSSDPEFLAFVKNDPLAGSVLSIKFLKALYAWDRRIKTYKPLLTPVLVIQGTDDEIVDWKYNLCFLMKKMKNFSVEKITGAKHQLANERPELKSRVFELMMAYIKGRERK